VHQITARLTVFSGFEMPIWYKGVTPEHLAVRNGVGIFDISHMGRVLITGVDSERFLNHVVTNNVSLLLPYKAQYSVMCNKDGGIIDDFIVYRLTEERFLVVFNAGNREKDYNWLTEHVDGFSVKLEDISNRVAMFAVQGPNAEEALQMISVEDLSRIKRFGCNDSILADVKVFVARTGYTGEDGFEIFVWNASLAEPRNAMKVWKAVLETGESFRIEPCGLAARDTLRLEAGMCLYGNDIDESTTPLEARLNFVVKFHKEDFIGRDALLKQKDEEILRKRVGIRMTQQGIPRRGFRIFDEKNHEIGKITSGTFSPLLRYGIGMGYIQTDQDQKGRLVNVRIRNRLVNAEIVSFPFYDSKRYGYKREL